MSIKNVRLYSNGVNINQNGLNKTIKIKIILSLSGSLLLTSCGSDKQQNVEETAGSEGNQRESVSQQSTQSDSQAAHYAGLNGVDMSNPNDSELFIAKHITVCKMPTESDPTLALEAYETNETSGPYLKVTGNMKDGAIFAHLADGKTDQTNGPFRDDSEDEPFFYH